VGSRVLVGALRADFEGTVAEFDLPQSSVRGQLIAKGGGGAGQSLDLLTYDAGQVVATVVTLTGGFFSCPYLPRGMYTVVANRTVLRTFSLAHQQLLDVGQLELPTP